MFTGIVRFLGEVIDIDKKPNLVTWKIKSDLVGKLKTGDSVMTHGVCLTVTELFEDSYTVDIIPETLKCTTLGNIELNDKVHLEPSLRVEDTVDGHFVWGHVDTTTKLKQIYDRDLYELEFELPKSHAHLIAKKGSVSINGVSLTVADISPDTFTVALIPETLRLTTMASLVAGDSVNIEIDMVARYMERILSLRN